MDNKMIDRINELAHKQKNEGLSPEEKTEQKELREKYLKEFRKNFRAQLENIDIEYVDEPEEKKEN